MFHDREMHFIQKEQGAQWVIADKKFQYMEDDFYEHASVLMEDLLTLVVLWDLNYLLNQVCRI